MVIKNLTLENVRNHTLSNYELAEEVIFTGVNGSGKTTVLESIYLLTAMRGFKKQPLSSVLSYDEKYLRIAGNIVFDDSEFDTALFYDGKKVLTIDGSSVESVSEYIYNHPVACYSPENQGILSLQQSDRRSFLDRYIFYSDKQHIDDLRLYNRLITQKTAEYESDKFDPTYLDVLDERIVSIGQVISKRRYDMISLINLELDKVYDTIGFPMERVYVSYGTNIKDMDILARERYKRRVDYGIQRDRVDMAIAERVIEKFSSFGQKKMFALLCLYSIITLISGNRNMRMMALLDDFEAGLDIGRASLLKERFSDMGQTIYTGVENTRLGFKNTILLQG